MISKDAKGIVEAGESAGLTQKQMAEICEVSPVTISRWKMLGIARTSAISRLQRYLDSPSARASIRKYLDEAALEDLAERARQLGFRITFTDINITTEPINADEIAKGEASMFFFRKKQKQNENFKDKFDRERVEKLCHALTKGTRGVTLGKKILEQLDEGCLDQETYAMLSRWVNPRRAEHFAQPIAAQVSKLLYGREIERIEE